MPKLARITVLLFVSLLVAACGGDATETEVTQAPESAELSAAAPSLDLLPHQQMARDFLKELVEIDTTDATGDNTAAAQAMAAEPPQTPYSIWNVLGLLLIILFLSLAGIVVQSLLFYYYLLIFLHSSLLYLELL